MAITEGDEGNTFYIVESGEFKVTKSGVAGEVSQRLTAGTYFGERALITNDVCGCLFLFTVLLSSKALRCWLVSHVRVGCDNNQLATTDCTETRGHCDGCQGLGVPVLGPQDVQAPARTPAGHYGQEHECVRKVRQARTTTTTTKHVHTHTHTQPPSSHCVVQVQGLC